MINNLGEGYYYFFFKSTLLIFLFRKIWGILLWKIVDSYNFTVKTNNDSSDFCSDLCLRNILYMYNYKKLYKYLPSEYPIYKIQFNIIEMCFCIFIFTNYRNPHFYFIYSTFRMLYYCIYFKYLWYLYYLYLSFIFL